MINDARELIYLSNNKYTQRKNTVSEKTVKTLLGTTILLCGLHEKFLFFLRFILSDSSNIHMDIIL